MTLRALLLLLLAGVLRTAEPLAVVTTTPVLADIVRQVGGDRVNVHCLLRPGTDPHVFQPTPDDARTLAQAALVVENGLGLEGWLNSLVTTSGFRGHLVTATIGIAPLPGGPDEHDGAAADPAGHHHDGVDPHAWHDAANGIRYAQNVRDGLTAADPAGAADYAAWCELYCAQLRVVDAWIRRQIGSLPPARRVLATGHAALAYYAAAYGLRPQVVEGVTTGQEPDPRRFAALITRLRQERVPAVFAELGSAPALMERLAQEAGAALGGPLIVDTLPADGRAGSTYIGMLTLNTRMIVRALQTR